MNRKALVQKIAREARLPKDKASAALDGIALAITSSLRRGEKVTLAGLGTFSVTRRRARLGRSTGTRQLVVAAKKTARFTAAKSLKAGLSRPAVTDPFIEALEELSKYY